MKRTVRTPRSPSRSRARAIASRTSFTPLETADRLSISYPAAKARIRASVVFPVPAGPQRIIEVS